MAKPESQMLCRHGAARSPEALGLAGGQEEADQHRQVEERRRQQAHQRAAPLAGRGGAHGGVHVAGGAVKHHPSDAGAVLLVLRVALHQQLNLLQGKRPTCGAGQGRSGQGRAAQGSTRWGA